ncbi:MAG: carbon monoxide dehydrogenase subunit G [Acidobacteriota bacterium]
MKIEGQHTFEAPRELVWKTVLDPTVLAAVLPGCEDFQEVGDNEFTGTLKIKVGPVQGKFKGNVQLSDLQEPESYQMRIKGKGAPGFVDGQGQLRLEDAGSSTVLHYSVDAKVGGRIASVGQRLLDSSSKVITRQALEGLEQQVVAQAASEAGEAAPEVEAPSQAEFAAEVAKGVVDDLVPQERRPMLYGIGALVVLAIVLLALRGCGG